MASEATATFDEKRAELDTRLEIVSGKRALKELRRWLQEEYGIILTGFQILDAYWPEDVPPGHGALGCQPG
ncbi:MAG: hypothetical protein OXE83_01440 [Gammaproteobacteria bacterium]|nr:hypothetical protein [Gammaproteobacteria bacterium]